jgi:uncharacterized protein (DUF697 family)
MVAMSRVSFFRTLRTVLTEIDVGPIREQVQKPLRLALMGSNAGVLEAVRAALQMDPFRPVATGSAEALAIYPLPVPAAELHRVAAADAVFLVPAEETTDLRLETEVLTGLHSIRPRPPVLWVHWGRDAAAAQAFPQTHGADDQVFVHPATAAALAAALTPALLRWLPERGPALGHHVPGLRAAIAEHLIEETCVVNAAFVAGTGLAELVPVLGLPLGVADMAVLTKNQAVLSYKLALALGYDGTAVELVGPLAGVVGAGFLWRQLARTVVGLIPALGLPAKIAVAYAGTYVTGHAVYHWYAHGARLSRAQMQELQRRALERGRARATAIMARLRASRRSSEANPTDGSHRRS